MKNRQRIVVQALRWLAAWSLALCPLRGTGAEPLEPFFPIMPWNWAPNDAKVLHEMKDCGLTMAGFVTPAALTNCQAAGLKAIVSDPRTSGYDWRNVDASVARRQVSSLVAEVGGNPAVFGYYLVDEPNRGQFAGLAIVAGLIRELDPGKWAYINLFPTYASQAQLGTLTYADYLGQFAATCQPTTISYDHYALMDDGTLRHGYWSNLEQVRASALQQKVPFWNIVLTVAHFSYREVTAADVRFQAYTTLAYGGRGLSYFTYFAPAVGNYRMAPVDQFGNRTPTWYYLQNVNRQIQKLAPTLLQLTSNEVYHFGEAPDGCHNAPETSLVRDPGSPEIMVGDFTHSDGSRYVMLVNKNFTHSRACRPVFRRAYKKIELVSPYSGALESYAGEHMWLAPGQGTLLKLSE
jgi:hypothetical protein